jgi:hypothetical protein
MNDTDKKLEILSDIITKQDMEIADLKRQLEDAVLSTDIYLRGRREAAEEILEAIRTNPFNVTIHQYGRVDVSSKSFDEFYNKFLGGK